MTDHHVATTGEEYAALPEGTIVGDHLAPNKIGLEVLWQKLPDGLWWRYSTGQYYATLDGDTRPVLRHGWGDREPPPNKPKGEPMTDRAQEILDLVKKRDHHYEGYMETCSELRNRARNRHDEVDPLEGEVWHVILASSGCARTVVPAIKGIIGWHVAPTSVESTLDDDCHITSSHVYPVERVAEAPRGTEGAE